MIITSLKISINPATLIADIFLRGKDVFLFFPVRLKRLIHHFYHFENLRSVQSGFDRFWLWWLILLFQILDLLGAGEWMESVLLLTRKNGRKLLEEEKQILEKYFGPVKWAGRIHIRDRRRLGTRKGQIAYVTGSTINSFGPLPEDVLVHELVHIWQYFEKGLCYIPLALYAQQSDEGYNYGGKARLVSALKSRNPLFYFNWEQQAALVQDHFRGEEGLPFQYADDCDTEVGILLNEILIQSGLLKRA